MGCRGNDSLILIIHWLKVVIKQLKIHLHTREQFKIYFFPQTQNLSSLSWYFRSHTNWILVNYCTSYLFPLPSLLQPSPTQFDNYSAHSHMCIFWVRQPGNIYQSVSQLLFNLVAQDRANLSTVNQRKTRSIIATEF